MIRVRKVNNSLSEVELESVMRLNEQLTGERRDIMHPPYSAGTMFLAEEQGIDEQRDDKQKIVGMITVCIYDAPSGKKAWIEDFVVDENVRGSGAGKALMDSALDYAQESGAKKLMLTSRPSRYDAHHFYERYGFCRRDTDVFILPL